MKTENTIDMESKTNRFEKGSKTIERSVGKNPWEAKHGRWFGKDRSRWMDNGDMKAVLLLLGLGLAILGCRVENKSNPDGFTAAGSVRLHLQDPNHYAPGLQNELKLINCVDLLAFDNPPVQKIHSGGDIEPASSETRQFMLLTIANLKNDSLQYSVEIFRVSNGQDTLRILNSGMNKDPYQFDRIREVVCLYANK